MIEIKKKSHEVHIGNIPLGAGNRWALIAGPCAIEGEEMAMRTAETIAEIAASLDIPFIFKGSYDKANRLSGESPRGIGIEHGLDILAKVRSDVGVPTLTDIHDAPSADVAAGSVDCLQIPAFLCRQTDIVAAAARTGLPLNIKKGQFLAPEDMAVISQKAVDAGAKGVTITERGTSFGYHNLVVDFRGIPIMAHAGWPIVMDISHCLQRPGGDGITTGGDREFTPHMALAAIALKIDAIYMEIHPDPENAISDKKTQWPLARARELLELMKNG